MRKRTLYRTGAAVAALATGVAMAVPAVAGASGGSTPTVSVTQFTNTFKAMAALKPVTKQGKGKVAAILPDTTSSTRYVEFDQPDLKKAMQKAGLPTSDIIVQNAQGSDTTQLTDAQTDITNGATVLLVDPLDSGVGAEIESYAKSHGVKVIDYDRLTLGGSRAYYVSFNNVRVGQLIGKGFVSCVTAWHVKTPKVIVMHGAATDNNATLFYKGYYTDVLSKYFKKGTYKSEAKTADTWTPTVALTEFESAFTAHPTANSAVIPNDETGAPIISYLQGHGVKPRTFPTTGQDATLTGLDNVLSGYQCGTVYKPIYLEAQGAVALAVYLRAGKTPPKGLVNGKTKDTTENKTVPSVLLVPEWVTTKNMKTTIVKDNFVPTATLCAGSYASDCKAAGITP